jgi:EAL domain-containing protein (putative c-di-GMP-specific phosphodiesterase class I)
MERFSVASDALHALAARGVDIVIDDFGSGYSSISRLQELPVAGMKIDRSLCMDLGRDPHRDAVVQSIVDLAHALGLWVVVEGIEDVRAATTSLALGADVAQGYYFARPLPADDLPSLLRHRPRP